MSDKIEKLQAENQRLRERNRQLGHEKANLQMAMLLVKQVADTVDQNNVIGRILQILVGAIGGAKIAIYYETEEHWNYFDTLGIHLEMEQVDDSLVNQCLEQKCFIKKSEQIIPELALPGKAQTYETWVYPLEIHGNLYGVLRLQGMAIEHAHYRENIDPFIKYASLVLYHEITNVKKLMVAYEKVDATRKELEQKKEQFELAMMFANEGIFDWDLETNAIYFSPVWKSLLGYNDDEIKNDFSEWERLTNANDVESSWIMLKEVLDGKRKRFEKEFKMLHKDGHWVDILARANVIFKDGKGVRVVGTHVDISHLKKMENALRESEIKYRSIMEATKDPTYLSSQNFVIEYMNPAMNKWLGGDFTGKLCYHSIHGFDEPCSWCRFEDVKKNKAASSEFKSPRDNRKYIASNSPINHTDGSISKLTVYHDVTEIMDMEARLQQALKMESIGNLAGGIAHDFNNILSPIIGLAELLTEDLKPGSNEYDNAKEILIAGQRGAALVKQILAFSRHSDHQKQSINLPELLKEVLRLCKATIPANIEIEDIIDKDCGTIFADPTQIQQVALNLLTNAFHAVEDTGGKITLSLKEIFIDQTECSYYKLKSGAYALVSISDTGHGIRRELINKIFEPYFTTKEQGKGTGLGLASAYGIVKDHKGDIRVYSEVSKGSTFHVYLPLDGSKTFLKKEIRNDLYPTGDERVLIIDDEPAIVKMEMRLLERLGYKVTFFTDSSKALKVFQENSDNFDLILTDMTMPGMTGDKFAQKIISIRQDIPIIICTGFSERINQHSLEDIGVKALLMKPTGIKEISNTVRRVLNQDKTNNPSG